MKNKLYLLIISVTLLFAIFTQGDFPRFLLGFEFLLWLALFIWAHIQRRYLRCTMSPPMSQSPRNSHIPLEVNLENTSVFPVPELLVTIKCLDEYSGTQQTFKSSAMLDGRETAQLRWTIQAEHYGMLTVSGYKYTILDPLGVSQASAFFPPQSWQIAVLPPLSANADARNPVESMGDDDTVSFGEASSSGSDYELRLYREGEPLRNVHWKLTAKTGDLMIREYPQDVGSCLQILLDLNTYGKPFSRSDYDFFLEAVAAFAAGHLIKGTPFILLWHSGNGQLCRMPVYPRQDALKALTALLCEKPQNSESTHNENTTHETYGAAVRLNLWGEITGTEALR